MFDCRGRTGHPRCCCSDDDSSLGNYILLDSDSKTSDVSPIIMATTSKTLCSIQSDVRHGREITNSRQRSLRQRRRRCVSQSGPTSWIPWPVFMWHELWCRFNCFLKCIVSAAKEAAIAAFAAVKAAKPKLLRTHLLRRQDWMQLLRGFHSLFSFYDLIHWGWKLETMC